MSDESHLGGSGPNGDPITAMYDVWGYVCYKYGLHSVLDIGCALGFNARWLLDRGFDVIGVEGLPEYVVGSKLPRDRIVQHDYTTGPWVPSRDFDLGICTEFVEHVEAQFIPNFVATFKCCRYVLMTHALPGQGGWHHVNEQPFSYWESVMNQAGFTHLPNESEKLRATFIPSERYGRNTLSLFFNMKNQ